MGIKAKLVTAVIYLQDFEIVLEIFFFSASLRVSSFIRVCSCVQKASRLISFLPPRVASHHNPPPHLNNAVENK